jgi:hypothetical protein
MAMFKKKHTHYENIEDCPIWNFSKVGETGDLRYLLKLEQYNVLPKIDTAKLSIVYEQIINTIIAKFGISESLFTKGIEEKALLILKLKYLAGEKHLWAIIKIKEKQFEEKQTDKKAVDFTEQVVIMESHFKVPFDVHKMSIDKFYTYLKLYQDVSNRAKAEHLKNQAGKGK